MEGTPIVLAVKRQVDDGDGHFLIARNERCAAGNHQAIIRQALIRRPIVPARFLRQVGRGLGGNGTV